VDQRSYSSLLSGRTGRPAITYKCVGDLDEAGWHAWLDAAARDHGVQFLSVIGRPTSGVRYPLALSQAIRLTVAHPGRIHRRRRRHRRTPHRRAQRVRPLLAKGIGGCAYFVSQTVYHAEASIRLLADYARDCRGAGVQPRRIVLSFSPVGREKTMSFLKWLGVQIPPDTAHTILAASNPLAKSIDVCRDNLRMILEQPYAREIPLGVSVESVSINKDEIDASVDLFHTLAGVMRKARADLTKFCFLQGFFRGKRQLCRCLAPSPPLTSSGVPEGRRFCRKLQLLAGRRFAAGRDSRVVHRARPRDAHHASKEPQRAPWLIGGAFSMGMGIWSMHFIGMLAFSLPDPDGLRRSDHAAVDADRGHRLGFALYTVSRDKVTWKNLVVGGF
jgi:hypothetical protein